MNDILKFEDWKIERLSDNSQVWLIDAVTFRTT